MLFASVELASRVEAAERGLLIDSIASVERRRPDVDALVMPLAGGVAAIAERGSPLTKIVGLGFAGPVDEADLLDVERAFAQRGHPVQVELSSLADPSVALLLTRRGYVLTGFENVLGQSLVVADDLRAGSDIEVSPSGEEEFDIWLDAIITGFSHPDTQGLSSSEEFPREALERIVGDMASAPGFCRFLARRHGEPVGGASMRMSERVAQLCGAATVPAHRHQGVQTALLAHRLRAASRDGCDLAIATVLPGSRSHRNVQRRGFSLLYTRVILVREFPASI